jgi:hypothetical protein
MQTIEFQSVVENDTIHIPEPYKGQLTSPVTVMIFADDIQRPKIHRLTKTGPLTPNDFSAIKLNTKGFKFNREEANERMRIDDC